MGQGGTLGMGGTGTLWNLLYKNFTLHYAFILEKGLSFLPGWSSYVSY